VATKGATVSVVVCGRQLELRAVEEIESLRLLEEDLSR